LPHFLKARRQHVLKEAPQELQGVELHRTPAPAAGLLPAEANATVFACLPADRTETMRVFAIAKRKT
jgi:hypothetical protein